MSIMGITEHFEMPVYDYYYYITSKWNFANVISNSILSISTSNFFDEPLEHYKHHSSA